MYSLYNLLTLVKFLLFHVRAIAFGRKGSKTHVLRKVLAPNTPLAKANIAKEGL
jgi:hypothetical protein